MSRTFVVPGECLVQVKFGDHISITESQPVGNTQTLFELGLASEQIRISPRLIHHDIHIDDFGPDIPAEVLAMLADVTITMQLIYYDPYVLDACLSEAMGGVFPGTDAGTLAPAGTPLGGNQPLMASGNHYVGLGILTPQATESVFPWRFPACYMVGNPFEMPLGTEKTIIGTTWRAIPYTYYQQVSTGVFTELISSGAPLWDHRTYN